MKINLKDPIFVECPACHGSGLVYNRKFGGSIKCPKCGGAKFISSDKLRDRIK